MRGRRRRWRGGLRPPRLSGEAHGEDPDIDAQGQRIPVGEGRTEPLLKLATYGAETPDPGQVATQSLDVNFPAEPLKAKKLKENCLELAYIPSPYKEESVNFTVAISGR